MVFLDVRSILGPKMEPKLEKNGIKKHIDFLMMLEGRMPAISPSSWSRDGSLGTTTMTRPIGLNNIIRSTIPVAPTYKYLANLLTYL